MSPFGNTCPCLKIAKHYGVDYALTLALTDYYLHGRELRQELVNDAVLSVATYLRMEEDCREVARDTRDAWDIGDWRRGGRN